MLFGAILGSRPMSFVAFIGSLPLDLYFTIGVDTLTLLLVIMPGLRLRRG